VRIQILSVFVWERLGQCLNRFSSAVVLIYSDSAIRCDSPAMEETSGDKRYDFISDYVLKTLKLKLDKWQKCVGVEENKLLMQEFLDKADNNLLILALNQGGLLLPSYDFPPAGKTKAVYFIKRAKENVTGENIQTQLLFGDLSYAPLDQMSALVDDVSILSRNSLGPWCYHGFTVKLKCIGISSTASAIREK